MKYGIIILLMILSGALTSQEIGLSASFGPTNTRFFHPLGWDTQGHFFIGNQFSLMPELGFRYYYSHTVTTSVLPAGPALTVKKTELLSSFTAGIAEYYSPFSSLKKFNFRIGVGEYLHGFILPNFNIFTNELAIVVLSRFELALPLRIEFPSDINRQFALHAGLVPSVIFKRKKYYDPAYEMTMNIYMIRLQFGLIYRLK